MSEQQQQYGADVAITDEEAERLQAAGFEVFAGADRSGRRHVRLRATDVVEAERRLERVLGDSRASKWARQVAP